MHSTPRGPSSGHRRRVGRDGNLQLELSKARPRDADRLMARAQRRLARWEGALDQGRMQRILNNESDQDADEPERVLDVISPPEPVVR